jgi:hypothetical protein
VRIIFNHSHEQLPVAGFLTGSVVRQMFRRHWHVSRRCDMPLLSPVSWCAGVIVSNLWHRVNMGSSSYWQPLPSSPETVCHGDYREKNAALYWKKMSTVWTLKHTTTIITRISASWTHYGPGADSAYSRNKYQGYLLEGKGGQCVGLTSLPLWSWKT